MQDTTAYILIVSLLILPFVAIIQLEVRVLQVVAGFQSLLMSLPIP
jgi:hypothetical protein